MIQKIESKSNKKINISEKKIARFLGKIKGVCIQLLLAIKFLLRGKSSQPFLTRLKIFFSYLKFKYKDLFYNYILRRRVENEKIFGCTIKFPDYSIFRSLFMEIFILEQYYFKTDKSSLFIVDCGSNIGISVLYFKIYYPNSRIVAFEPDPESFTFLKSNVENNNLKGVEFYNLALSDKDAEIEFYVDKTNSIANSAARNVKKVILEDNLLIKKVCATILSKFINQDVDFLKIDVEGYEDKIILELVKKNKLHFVKNMAIEYHPGICEEIKNEKGLEAFLKDCGIDCVSEKTEWKNYLIYAKSNI